MSDKCDGREYGGDGGIEYDKDDDDANDNTYDNGYSPERIVYLMTPLIVMLPAMFSDWQGVGQNVARDIAPGRLDHPHHQHLPPTPTPIPTSTPIITLTSNIIPLIVIKLINVNAIKLIFRRGVFNATKLVGHWFRQIR